MKSIATFIFLFIWGFLLEAQSLDPTFGTIGRVKFPAGTSIEQFRAMGLQKNGRIVTVGSSNKKYLIKRYLTNGQADKSFGIDGKVSGSFSDSVAILYLVVIQPDDKIVVCQKQSSYGGDTHFTLARFLSDGDLDMSFGKKGFVVTSFDTENHEINAIALQNDGKILLAGYKGNGTNRDMALSRFTENGDSDTTFGLNGKLIFSFCPSSDWAASMKVLSNGQILVTGGAIFNSRSDIVLLRLEQDGSFDKSFGKAGIASANIGIDDEGTSIQIQDDNKIIVGGWAQLLHQDRTNGNDLYAPDFSVVRFNSDGNLDSGFSGDGISCPYDYFRETGYLHSLFIQRDGKIVAGGTYWDGSDYDSPALQIIRFNKDGSIDENFGSKGFFIMNPVGFYSIIKQVDGKLIIGGNNHDYKGKSDYEGLIRIFIDGLSTSVFGRMVKNDVKIYPNPTRGSVTLLIDVEGIETATFELFDLNGKLVKSYELNLSGDFNSLDLSQFMDGLYYYKLYNEGIEFNNGKIALIR